MELDALLREMAQAEGAVTTAHDSSEAHTAAAADSAEWERRLAQAKQRDKQLKQAAASSSSSSKFAAEKHLFSLRKQLQHAYAALIASDLVRADACDVEHALWKSCIYKPIEALRKLLRLATPSANAKRYSEQLERYAKLHAFCARFLGDACKYFERAFFARLPQSGWEAVPHEEAVGASTAAASSIPQLSQVKLRPASGSASAAACPSDALRDASLRSCHRCLLFRGDLERYTQLMLHEPAALKWIAAARLHQDSSAQPASPSVQSWNQVALFYQQAITLQPGVGGPWNQLAVLATYEDDSLTAVSHYVRALTCTEPFTTAKINLQLLLEKQRDVPMLLRHSQQHAGQLQTLSLLFPSHPVCGFFAQTELDRLWLILYELLFAASSPPHPELAALPCVAAAVSSQFAAWIGRDDGQSKASGCVRSAINLIFLCQHSAPSSPPSAVHQTAVGLCFDLLSVILSSIRSVHHDCVGVVVVFLRWLQLHPAFAHDSLVPLPIRQTFWRQLALLINLAAAHLASPAAQDGEPMDECTLLPEQQEVLGCALFEPALPVAPVAGSSSGSPDASLLLGQQGSQSSADVAAAATDVDAPMSSGPHSATHRRCSQLMRLAAFFVTQRAGLGKQEGSFHSLLDSAAVEPPSSLPALEPASSPARARSSAAPHAAAAAAALAMASAPSAAARALLPPPTLAAFSPPPQRHDPAPAVLAVSPPTDLMQDVEPPQPADATAASSAFAAPVPAASVPLPPPSRCPALSSVALSAGSVFTASYARLHFPQFAAAMVE